MKKMMKGWRSTALLLFVAGAATAQEPVKCDYGKIRLSGICDSASMCFVNTKQIVECGLDTMPEVKFWRRVITMPPDTGLLSVASTRQVLGKFAVNDWDGQKDEVKEAYRDSLRKLLSLSDSESIYFTTGKNDFYDVAGVIPQIDRGVQLFEENNTDPFYAQAILLIESPVKLQKSNVGAFGAFQLMKGVAINMGLKVNKSVDERKDFDKSAWAAAKLIRTVCIPYTNAMLEKRGICYNPTDLWYRLLVLHVYHAGAGNVDKALDVFAPKEGNIDLIKTLWHTKAGAFGKSSQSYSQVAVSAMLELTSLLDQRQAASNSKGTTTPGQ